MKFYMIFYKPYGGFFYKSYDNWDNVTFTCVDSGQRFATYKGAKLCMESIVHNENNRVSQDNLVIYEFTGVPVDENQGSFTMKSGNNKVQTILKKCMYES